MEEAAEAQMLALALHQGLPDVAERDEIHASWLNASLEQLSYAGTTEPHYPKVQVRQSIGERNSFGCTISPPW